MDKETADKIIAHLEYQSNTLHKIKESLDSISENARSTRSSANQSASHIGSIYQMAQIAIVALIFRIIIYFFQG